MTSTIEEDSKTDKIFLKSVAVGALGVVLAIVYLIDGSPNDSNIGFWLYTPTSMFFLWPYQVVLAIKLHAFELSGIKYLGVILSVLSVIMTIGIW